MNKPEVIDIGWEPSDEESKYLEMKALDTLVQNEDEIRVLEKYYAQDHDVLQQWAWQAYFYFCEAYRGLRKDETSQHLFVGAVCFVITPVSPKYYDGRLIMKGIISEVCSRVSKIIWKGRKERELRKKLYPPKRPSYEEIKERRTLKMAEASDVLMHGTLHGELYLNGIKTRNPSRPRTKKRASPPRHPRREKIYTQDQLGSIIAQADAEVRRQNCLMAFGVVPSYE